MTGNFLNTIDAAKRLTLSPRTLETMRTKGGGPTFCKLGRRVAYRDSDLEEWAKNGLRRNTAEYLTCITDNGEDEADQAVVRPAGSAPPG